MMDYLLGYEIFWDSIAQILMECFNESFAKGEMSSTQRQAVITLIEIKAPMSNSWM